MDRNDTLLQELISQGKTAQALQYQKEQWLKQLNEEREKEKLVDEITKRVIQNMSVNVDVSNAIMQIEKLNNAIKSIGK